MFFHLGHVFSLGMPVTCEGWSLRCSPGQGKPRGCVVIVYVREGSEREQCCFLCSLLSASFQSFPLLPTIKLGPSGAASWVGGFLYILWVSATNSPVRLGVSPTAASTPTGVFTQKL